MVLTSIEVEGLVVFLPVIELGTTDHLTDAVLFEFGTAWIEEVSVSVWEENGEELMSVEFIHGRGDAEPAEEVQQMPM